MNISKEHWLDGVTRDPIEGGNPMNVRRCLVIHFTAGASAKSSIESMRDNGLSCHLVIDRDGTIFQCRPFNRQCAHAGKSRWRDPKTGTLYVGANSYSIGIELANAGNDPGALSWARKQPGFERLYAQHRNGGPVVEWEAFYNPQFYACIAAAKALVARYNLDDVTSHDAIAPERKDDVGPAFPMPQLRNECGFGMTQPAVHRL